MSTPNSTERTFLPRNSQIKSDKFLYHINEHVGRGGTSLVYRATIVSDCAEKGHHVIIKELFPANSEIVQPTRAEDGSLGIIKPEPFSHFVSAEKEAYKLSSKMLDDGSSNDPHSWIYCDEFETNSTYYQVCFDTQGKTLADKLQNNTVPHDTVFECVQIALDTIAAVRPVHAHNYVHCDIKPTNIFVVDSNPPTYRCIDFGSAIPFGSLYIHSSSYDYAAREIKFSEDSELLKDNKLSRPADYSLDTYSIIAMLYQLVTGRSARHRRSDGTLSRGDGEIFNLSDEALTNLNALFSVGLTKRGIKDLDRLELLLKKLLPSLNTEVYLTALSPEDFSKAEPSVQNLPSNKIFKDLLDPSKAGTVLYLDTIGAGAEDYLYACACFAQHCRKPLKPKRNPFNMLAPSVAYHDLHIVPVPFIDSLENTLLHLPYGKQTDETMTSETVLSHLKSLSNDYYIVIHGYIYQDSDQRYLSKLMTECNCHFLFVGIRPEQSVLEKRIGKHVSIPIPKATFDHSVEREPIIQYLYVCGKYGLDLNVLLGLPNVSPTDIGNLCNQHLIYYIGNRYYISPHLFSVINNAESKTTESLKATTVTKREINAKKGWKNSSLHQLAHTILKALLSNADSNQYYYTNGYQRLTRTDFRLCEQLFHKMNVSKEVTVLLTMLYKFAGKDTLIFKAEIINLYKDIFSAFCESSSSGVKSFLFDNLIEYATLYPNPEDRAKAMSAFPILLFEATKDYEYALYLDIKNKKYKVAIKKVARLLELYEYYGTKYIQKIETLHEQKAKCYFYLSDFTNAFKDYSICIELNDTKSSYWHGRGSCYYKLGKWQEALDDFDQAITLNSSDASNWFCRGCAYYKLKKWQEALDDFDQAITLNSSDASNWYWRGCAYYELEKWQLALGDFDEAITLNHSWASAWCWRGCAYYKLKQWQKALDDFNQAITLDSSDASNWYWRGCTYYELEKWQLALGDFDEAITLNHSWASAWLWRGCAYYKLKQWQKALDDFDEAITLNHSWASAWCWRGCAYYKLKQWQKALDDFNQAITLDSSDASNWYWRGCTYFELEKWQLALGDFDEAITLNHSWASAWYWRGRSNVKLIKWQNAIDDFSKAIELEPSDWTNWYWCGFSYGLLKNWKSASDNFSKALELNPSNANIWFWYGQSCFEIGNWQDAINALSESIRQDVSEKYSWYYRGCSSEKLGDLQNALDDITKAFRLDPSNQKFQDKLNEIREKINTNTEPNI